MTNKNVWTIVILIGGYIACQMLADIGATKLVAIGNYAIPGGTFVFAITFTLRDLIHKRLGKQWAKAAIWSAGGINILMSLYLLWISKMDGPVFIPPEVVASWASIFAIVPSIVVASITAEVVSELLDTEVYHRVMGRFTGKWQFLRVLISNAVSLPVDSLIFGFLAFMILPPILGGGTHTFSEVLDIAWGQIIFKAIVTLISLPLIYLVKEEKIV
jgi:uncharacterized integral membrane protein (TIGR00697 family)